MYTLNTIAKKAIACGLALVFGGAALANYPESGIEVLKNFDMHFAFLLMAPKGLDKNISEKWNAAIARAMQSEKVKAQFDKLNLRSVSGSSQEAQQWVVNYDSRIRATIKQANIRVE
ncbi:hypothetical protein CAP48_13210 [Advenella sp. S44]|uniref:tripartite tricarboxylate transporter substrate-binding protein n=1 Tax=Advenella sp. S44 TaxID=1982755 RepID=UPI000C2AB936|nr:tripartite tricarboxylate transporter substrate-binding protein [Advenella sp. S44]PJX23017.1 hypothetical protein CAP48_13210 [Advenella sp. S44]